MPQIAWGKAGEGTWQKVGDACNVCGPDGCDHTHMPTGLEQSLEEMEFARSACSAAQAGDLEKLRRCLERNPAAVYHDGGSGRTGYTPLHYAARCGRRPPGTRHRGEPGRHTHGTHGRTQAHGSHRRFKDSRDTH